VPDGLGGDEGEGLLQFVSVEPHSVIPTDIHDDP